MDTETTTIESTKCAIRPDWIVLALAIIGLQCAFGQSPTETQQISNHDAAVKEPELAKELSIRVQSDQAARSEFFDFFNRHDLPIGTVFVDKLEPTLADEFTAISKKMQGEDQKNLLWMKDVIRRHGWPGKSLVGSIGAHDAWLLIQHADTDRDFQQECLSKIKAMPNGEVASSDIAYLTDRILIGKGEKQTYGTQAIFRDGKIIPSPIENEEHVDERRRDIGLEPLSEYLKSMESFYGSPKKSESNGKKL